VFISFDCIFISLESDVGPSSFAFNESDVTVDDLPLHVLVLNEFLKFISKSIWTFSFVEFQSFNV